MKKNTFLLFLIGISFFSCNRAKNPITPISNIETDFPITEKLEFKPFNQYDILENGGCMIDDSILWYFSRYDNQNIGFCYDLKTGEKLSTIATKGKATNEFTEFIFDQSKITGDSIQLYTGLKTIKTFAKKDIIENKPMNERGFSVTAIHDSIRTIKFVKLSNGSAVVMINGKPRENQFSEKNINNNSVAIIGNNEVKCYETIDYDSFDLTIPDSESFDSKDVIKNAYATGEVEIMNNNMAVFSVRYQFILYTLDLNKGNVIKEKRYTKMQRSNTGMMTTNDMKICIYFMKSDEKYIYCMVSGYFSENEKESKQRKHALFVFDWNLNPIKRFDLPNEKNTELIMSSDCKSIYICEYTEEGLIMTKADLTI